MSRIAFVNGRYMPSAVAGTSIYDRGYQFADSIYEVVAVLNGRLIDEDLHLQRMVRPLDELQISLALPMVSIKMVIREIVKRNKITDGLVYLQVTRGIAFRDHIFPDTEKTKPVFIVTGKSIDMQKVHQTATKGVKVITTPDLRWARCDIKTTSLLPNVLAKQQAKQNDAFEAWLTNDAGEVVEGSSSNAWIITKDNQLVTRQLDNHILPGITRATILDIAKEKGLNIQQRPFTVEQAKNAKEAFMTSATSFAMPVVQIDDCLIGGGVVGEVVPVLRQAYFDKFL